MRVFVFVCRADINFLEESVISTTLARMRVNLDAANISVSAFAAIAEMPQSTLQTALQGRSYLGSEREAALLTLSVRCKQTLEAISPFTLNKTDWDTLKFLVQKRTLEQVHSQVAQLFAE